MNDEMNMTSIQSRPRRISVRRLALALLAAGLWLVLAALAILAGPPLVAQWTGSTRIETLQQGSLQRQYRVYRPAVPAPHPALVIDLHGSRTNGFLEELATRFDAQVERLGWIAVYPDAMEDGWEAYGYAHRPGIDDVGFISLLIDRLEESDAVDPDRIYVTGLSRGGMMAYGLACELSGRIAAIAAVAGTMADASGRADGVPCHPDRPVSVLAIHGSADDQVPIGGSSRFAPLAEVLRRWREVDACEPAATVTEFGAVTTSRWSCRAGSEVRSVVITGGGHTWPGIPLTSPPWNPSLDATAVVADFFTTHRRVPASR